MSLKEAGWREWLLVGLKCWRMGNEARCRVAMGEKWPRGCNTKPLPRNPSGLQVWGPPQLLFVLLWGWCSAPLGDARALGPSWAQLGSRRWPRAMTCVHPPAQLRPRGQQQPHREPGAPCDVRLGVLIRFGMGMEALWLGRHPPNQAGTGGAPARGQPHPSLMPRPLSY